MRARWNNDDFRRDVEAIRGDVAALKGDLLTAMRDLISIGGDGVGDARQRLQEQVQHKLDALNAASGDLGDYGREAARRVRRHIEERPAQSALIALGVAAVMGMLLMGGRRR
jgi:ElaB/YqjD/DUF883 family membrane-anchored ribosome-binding protein